MLEATHLGELCLFQIDEGERDLRVFQSPQFSRPDLAVPLRNILLENIRTQAFQDPPKARSNVPHTTPSIRKH